MGVVYLKDGVRKEFGGTVRVRYFYPAGGIVPDGEGEAGF
jgi:hypothetical protein